MNKKFEASVQIDASGFSGKVFKVLADTIRSGIKNEHGFNATKGYRDSRLAEWPIVVRFKTRKNRERFITTLQRVLHPRVADQLSMQRLCPTENVKRPFKMAVPA